MRDSPGTHRCRHFDGGRAMEFGTIEKINLSPRTYREPFRMRRFAA